MVQSSANYKIQSMFLFFVSLGHETKNFALKIFDKPFSPWGDSITFVTSDKEGQCAVRMKAMKLRRQFLSPIMHLSAIHH
jgi:hypothetical protein